MADIAVGSATLPIVPVDLIDNCQYVSLVANEALLPGDAVRIIASGSGAGQVTKAKATDNAEGRVFGIAWKKTPAGFPVSVIYRGILDGYTLDALDYGAPVYLSDTDGVLATTVGTVKRRIGVVVPRPSTDPGVDPDRVLLVDIQVPPTPKVDADFANAVTITDADTDDMLTKLLAELIANGTVASA